MSLYPLQRQPPTAFKYPCNVSLPHGDPVATEIKFPADEAGNPYLEVPEHII